MDCVFSYCKGVTRQVFNGVNLDRDLNSKSNRLATEPALSYSTPSVRGRSTDRHNGPELHWPVSTETPAVDISIWWCLKQSIQSLAGSLAGSKF